MALRSRFVAGHLVFYETHRMRIVDVVGPDVLKYVFSADTFNIQDEDATGTDPEGHVTTVVEVGAGTSEVHKQNTAGIEAQIVTAANENDGLNLQRLGENFEFTSNQSLVYFGVNLAINDVDQTDILVGLCIEDTTLLGGLSDGVYFECLDGSASVSAVTEKDSTETQTDSVGTMVDATRHTFEFFFDGTSVYFFFDGTQASTIHTANIPDDEALTPSIHFLTGEAVANTCDIYWMRAIAIGRT